MIVLDTAVLVYAVGGEHPLREPCERLVEAVAAGRVEATTSSGVIQEFAYVRARRVERAQAAAQAIAYCRLLAPLLPVRDADVEVALGLYAQHDRLDASDAVLAAAALGRGASALVSSDGGFADVPGLRYVDPATPDLDALLA